VPIRSHAMEQRHVRTATHQTMGSSMRLEGALAAVPAQAHRPMMARASGEPQWFEEVAAQRLKQQQKKRKRARELAMYETGYGRRPSKDNQEARSAVRGVPLTDPRASVNGVQRAGPPLMEATTALNDAGGLMKGGLTAANHISERVGSAGPVSSAVLGPAGVIMGAVGTAENGVRGLMAQQDAHRLSHAASESAAQDHDTQIQQYLVHGAASQRGESKRRMFRTGASVLATVGGALAMGSGTLATAGAVVGGAAGLYKLADTARYHYRRHKSRHSRQRMAAEILHSAMRAKAEHSHDHPHLKMASNMGVVVPNIRNGIAPIRSPEYKEAVGRLANKMSKQTGADWVHKTHLPERAYDTHHG
jgi:hypothetical protein